MSILRLSVYSYDKFTMTVYMNLKFVRASFGQYDTIDFVVILPPGKRDEAIEVEVVTHHSVNHLRLDQWPGFAIQVTEAGASDRPDQRRI
jgi:hypothetical protein